MQLVFKLLDILYKDRLILLAKDVFRLGWNIPNGCLDAYEVKVNIDIFKYQEKVKLISQFQTFFSFFYVLLEFTSFP